MYLNYIFKVALVSAANSGEWSHCGGNDHIPQCRARVLTCVAGPWGPIPAALPERFWVQCKMNKLSLMSTKVLPTFPFYDPMILTPMFKLRLGNSCISELTELSICMCALIEPFYLFKCSLFLVFLFLWCFLFIGSSLEVLNPWLDSFFLTQNTAWLFWFQKPPDRSCLFALGPHPLYKLANQAVSWGKTCRLTTLSNMGLNRVFLARDFSHQNNEAFNIIFLIPLLLSWFKNKEACFQMSCSTVPKNTWEYFVVADREGWRKIKTDGHRLTLSVPGLGFFTDPHHEIFVS